MKQRFSPLISYIVTFTLMVSVIAGALSVCSNFAFASSPTDSGVLYLNDLYDEFWNSGKFTITQLDNFFDYVNSYIDDSSWLVYVLHEKNTDNWDVQVFQLESSSVYSYSDGSGNGISDSSSGTGGYITCRARLYNGQYTYVNQNQFLYRDIALSRSIPWNFSWDSSYGNRNFPCSFNFNTANYESFVSHDIGLGTGGWSASKNLFAGDPPPETIDFEIIVFWLGERRFLTIKDQQLIRSLDGGGLYEYLLAVTFDYDPDVIDDLDVIVYDYSDLTLLQYSGIDDQLSNVSPSGVYAIDITMLDYNRLIDADLDEIIDSESVNIGSAINVPFILQEIAPEPGSDGTPSSYTQFWNEYYTYVNNYNNSPVVPDQLSGALFGINGLQCYPVSVAVPNVNLTTWKWWTSQSNLGINFDIMDTVLVHAGSAQYTLVYYYDHSLQAAFIPVQNMYLDSLFQSFDCVIIVPDDEGTLDQSNWWTSILTYLQNELNLQFDFTILQNYAVSGSSSGGVDFVSSVPSSADQILSGYCFVTPKGIEKQQLFNFSDGITKLYKLLSDYVASEDNWKTSFLQWSASWFSAINTLNGSISGLAQAISNLNLSSIEDKLDRIIENTSEEESNFWYEPLFWFVDQFKPAVSDFTNSIDAIDDSWDTMPLIPELSPVPTIPLIGGG